MKFVIATILYILSATWVASQGTLVLLVDVSSSIHDENMELQMNSYSQAMRQIRALQTMNVEVITFGSYPKHISSGSNLSAASAFDSFLVDRNRNAGSTCLNDALILVETMIDRLPKPIVIDISGDGEANCPSDKDIQATLDRIASHGIRINTLFIEGMTYTGVADVFNTITNPEQFYKSITRNDGFTMTVESFMDFELALFEKIVLEVAELFTNPV